MVESGVKHYKHNQPKINTLSEQSTFLVGTGTSIKSPRLVVK